MRVNGTHRRFRLRQDANMWWGFYQCPNPYGGGWIPKKSAGVHKRPSRISCLFRIEAEGKHRLKLSRKEN